MNNSRLVTDIKINNLAKTYCLNDWNWDTSNNYLEDFDMWAILDGKGCLYSDKKIYQLSRGDCLILRPQVKYVGEHDPHNPLVVIYAHFDYINETGNIIIPSEEDLPVLHRKIINFNFIEELLERMVSAYRDNSKPKCIAKNWLVAVLSELMDYDKRVKYSDIETKHSQMVDSICDEILRNPAYNYSVSEIARQHAYSLDHFCRIFKKYKNKTPLEYIILSKIETAKNLLAFSNHPISRISEMLGYKDIYYFSKQFSEKIGVSPSAYRKDDMGVSQGR